VVGVGYVIRRLPSILTGLLTLVTLVFAGGASFKAW
jgi:hypothetical protein